MSSMNENLNIIKALREMGATQIQVGDIRVVFELPAGDPYSVASSEPQGDDLLFYSAASVKPNE